MKLYHVNDTYRSKRRYEATLERANFVASIWETELEWAGNVSAKEWVEIVTLDGKNEILSALNAASASN